MPEDDRINFDPVSLLPKEVWLEPKPDNWVQPEKMYQGSGKTDLDEKDIWYTKFN